GMAAVTPSLCTITLPWGCGLASIGMALLLGNVTQRMAAPQDRHFDDGISVPLPRPSPDHGLLGVAVDVGGRKGFASLPQQLGRLVQFAGGLVQLAHGVVDASQNGIPDLRA